MNTTTKTLKTVDAQIETLKVMGQGALTTLGNSRPGMTTVTIAEITERRHDDVLKKARKFLKDIEATVGRAGNFAGTPLDAQEATYQDIQGKERPMLVLSRDVAQALLGTYNAKLAFATTVHLNHLLDQLDPSRSQVPVVATIAATLEAASEIREREKDNYRVAMKDIRTAARRLKAR
ncbi:Rha family transcriptional regulator [Pseudomonas fluorescens]|uniref:Rha family transcriptional regulator n=1 Tax=Pseudomonas fluorescens TaxID=294 RepID=UPI0006420E95|nr:Rha family transcriptional regulator [Pseudomonas fluorescens]